MAGVFYQDNTAQEDTFLSFLGQTGQNGCAHIL
jgi:hypothetical protein